jgi:hypothetical protein
MTIEIKPMNFGETTRTNPRSRCVLMKFRQFTIGIGMMHPHPPGWFFLQRFRYTRQWQLRVLWVQFGLLLRL